MKHFKPNKKVVLGHSINILGLILSCVLLFGEFKYYLSRPTYSSNTQEKIKPENFPDFLICPIPAFDLDKLAQYGYSSTYHFRIGQLFQDSDFVTWTGNSSSPVERVIQDISMLKSKEDCPDVMALFEDNIHQAPVDTVLSNYITTYGLCCQPVIPKEAKIFSLDALMIDIKRELINERNHDVENSSITGFQTFLSSQENSHNLKMNIISTNGISIKMFSEKDGFQKFSIKLTKNIKREDDPKASCQNYKRVDGYAQV